MTRINPSDLNRKLSVRSSYIYKLNFSCFSFWAFWPVCYRKKKLPEYYSIKNIYSIYFILYLFNIFSKWMAVADMDRSVHTAVIHCQWVVAIQTPQPIWVFFFFFFLHALLFDGTKKPALGDKGWKHISLKTQHRIKCKHK